MSLNTRDQITSHLTDMLALERHLQRALDVQLAVMDDTAGMARELRKVQQTCGRHVDALDALTRRRNAGRSVPRKSVKEAASAMLGVSAIAVDFVRTEQLPKNLPEDYAAVSLMCVGYVMVHRAALSRGEVDVIDLAYRCLQAHSRSTLLLRSADPTRGMRSERRVTYAVERADATPTAMSRRVDPDQIQRLEFPMTGTDQATSASGD
ncbi:MAG: hypothetical protein U0132_04020 [Gemmatimonadaceae bacterium]